MAAGGVGAGATYVEDQAAQSPTRRVHDSRSDRLQPDRTVQFRQPPVDRSNGKVTRLSRDLHNETILEAQGRNCSVVSQRGGHHLSVLQRQTFMTEHHFDDGRNLRMLEFVYRAENPSRFRQHLS